MAKVKTTRESGTITVITGASQSGKTTEAREIIAGLPRVIVWDHQAVWSDAVDVTCARLLPLVAAMRKAQTGPLRVAFQPINPTRELFLEWARAAYLWGQWQPCMIVAEELAEWVPPGKATGAWGSLVRTGLKYGIDILAITQAPSESDKSILRNATRIVCHRMGWETDIAYMARAMRVDPAMIAGLEGHQKIVRDLRDLSAKPVIIP